LPSAKDPDRPKCISCMMCMNTCPSGCITVVKQKAPKPTPEEQRAMAEAEARGEKVKKPAAPKNPARFVYDFSLCSLCGLCAEACPVNSIGFSSDVYMVVRQRSELKLDLLARLSAKARTERIIEEVA
jgi:NADH-quinone oxidoreductase subunit I